MVCELSVYALQRMCVKVPIVSQTSGLSLHTRFILISGGWVDCIIDSHSMRCVYMHAGVCAHVSCLLTTVHNNLDTYTWPPCSLGTTHNLFVA